MVMQSWAKTLIGFVLAFLVLVVVAVTTYINSRNYLASSRQVTHTNLVKQRLSDLEALIIDMETSQRGFVISGDPRFLHDKVANPTLVWEAITDIRLLTGDNDRQQDRLDELEPLIRDKIAFIADTIRIRREEGAAQAAAAVVGGRGETLMNEIHQRIDTMRQIENKLLSGRERDVQIDARNEALMLAVGVILQALLLGGVFWLVVRDRLNREHAAGLLRKTMAMQQGILDSANAIIIAADAHGIIHTVNPTAERWLGYRPSELIGQTGERLHLREEVERRAGELSAELGRPIPPGLEVFLAKPRLGRIDEHEWTYVRKDGSHLPVSLSLSPLRDERGALTGFIAIAHDLTLRKQAELQITRAKEAAEAATRAKSEFLASMSHEIRTPMNGVIGMTGLLLDTPLNDTQRAMAETVRSSADSLLTIINDILDFSKIEAGKLDLETTEFDLRQVVEDAITLLAEKAQGKGLELACTIAPEVPVAVSGDPGRIRQVLVNLLSNAVKFTERGEVVVRASLVSGDTSGLHRAIRGDASASDSAALLPVLVRFEVQDTGIGIPPSVQTKLFQAFSQADASTTRTFGGTGLGLAICKRLVEMMGGEIGVISAAGTGSTFHFTVKLMPRVAGNANRTPTSLGGVPVLVIDDNATNRTIMQQQLIGWGMRCDVAQDAPEGLRLLRSTQRAGRPFHLVLMDMQMPGMDGLALARIVKDDPELARVRLVLLSSMMVNDLSARAQEVGIAACLTKPVRQYLLRTTLVNLVTGEEHRQETAAWVKPVTRLSGRILVAEDNPVNQRLALAMLAKLGCRGDTVANGAEAIAATEQVPYDLVLMDCQMPEVDGYQATTAIRLREYEHGGRRLPIVAMTANAMSGDREMCLAAGMDDYVSKPVRFEQLAATLAQWLPQATSEQGHKTTGLHAIPVDVVNGTVIWFDPNELAMLQEQLGGDTGSIPEIIDIFLREAPQHVAAIAAAVTARDATALRQSAHRLNGSSQILGARAMSDACQHLEHCGQRGDLDPTPAMLATLQQALTQTLPLLERERQRRASNTTAG